MMYIHVRTFLGSCSLVRELKRVVDNTDFSVLHQHIHHREEDSALEKIVP